MDRIGPTVQVRLTDKRCWIDLGSFEISDSAELQRLWAAVGSAKAETFQRVEHAYQEALRESESHRLLQEALVEQAECERQTKQTEPLVQELTARRQRLLASGEAKTVAAQLAECNRRLADANAKHADLQSRLATIAEVVETRKQAADADVTKAITRVIHAEKQRSWQAAREAFEQLLGQRPGGSAEALAALVALDRGTRIAITQAETRLRERWKPSSVKKQRQQEGPMLAIGEQVPVAETASTD
ncbi:MAG: hypothetical protein JNM56_02925 [Planctomycetia bacterium]|nr:hypothetical protein [Planctomycetia bacterium]